MISSVIRFAFIAICVLALFVWGTVEWQKSRDFSANGKHALLVDLARKGMVATPLQMRECVKTGDVEALKILGELEVDFDSLDVDGHAPVHVAMDGHKWEVLEVVRKYAKELDSPDDNGKTPVHKLVDKGYLNLAQSFVDHGASVDFKISTDEGEVPASIFFLRSKNRKSFDFVVNNAADLNVKDLGGKRLLELAIEEGYVDESLKLIQYGADASILKLAGRNPLVELIEKPAKYILDEQQQVSLIDALMRRGADVNHSEVEGDRPLSVAMREGRHSVFDLLLQYVSLEPEYAWEALGYKRPEMLRSLLQSGLQVEMKNDEGDSLLLAAIKQSEDVAGKMVNVLLDQGADANQMAREGQRAIFVAIAGGTPDAAKALIRHSKGAEIHEPMLFPVSEEFRLLSNKKGLFDWYCRNVRGLTPLMIAVLRDKLYVAEDLVKKGANRTQATSAKTFPIQMAAGMKNVKMQQLLVGVPFEDDQQVRHYIIDLSQQKAYLYKNGKLIKSSRCSTGMKDFRTPTGEYIVTDKQKDKISNIYEDAEMPYFQRFSCKPFGFHEGATYAGFLSHGCIRLPMSTAKFFYNNSKVGDRVTIRK